MMRHFMLCGDRTLNDFPQILTVDSLQIVKKIGLLRKRLGGGGGGERKNLVSF